jgi:hypothetical protein
VWLNTIPSKQGYLVDGKPTRCAKIMFVMRNRAARDAKLAAAQVDALVILVQEGHEQSAVSEARRGTVHRHYAKLGSRG